MPRLRWDDVPNESENFPHVTVNLDPAGTRSANLSRPSQSRRPEV
jgi:hypothetical protein